MHACVAICAYVCHSLTVIVCVYVDLMCACADPGLTRIDELLATCDWNYVPPSGRTTWIV